MLDPELQLRRCERPMLADKKISARLIKPTLLRRKPIAERKAARNWENLDALPDPKSRLAPRKAFICTASKSQTRETSSRLLGRVLNGCLTHSFNSLSLKSFQLCLSELPVSVGASALFIILRLTFGFMAFPSLSNSSVPKI